MKDIASLQGTILFHGMDETDIKKTLEFSRAVIKTYKKHHTVLRAGGRTQAIGLVLSGSVTIESNDVWGNRTILGYIDTGDFFAETYALLRDETMLVDVETNEDSRILFLNISHIMYGPILSESWQVKLIRNLLMISSRKNLMLSGRSFHTSPKTARGRIEAYLNSVALRKKSREFDIPFDRQQMADYLNLDRTTLSKELKKMRDEGIIYFRKNHFVILEHP